MLVSPGVGSSVASYSPSDDDFVDPNGRFPEALFINWKHWEGVGGERGREAHGEVLRRVIKNHVVCVHIG